MINKQIFESRRLDEVGPLKAALTSRELGLRASAQGLQKGQLGLSRIQTGMSVANFVWPVIITLLTIMFIWGPGIAALLILLSSMSWWMWVIAIFLGLIIWRSF